MADTVIHVESIKGKPIEDILQRKKMARDYADGLITKEEYENFVNAYNARMKALAGTAWQSLREVKT